MGRSRADTRVMLATATAFATLITLCACERTEPAPRAVAPVPARAPVPVGDARLSDAAAFEAGLTKNRDAVLDEIGRVEFELQRTLMSFSGIEAGLGGPAAADAALHALMGEVHTRALQADYGKWMQTAGEPDVSPMGAVAQSAFEFTLLSLNFSSLYGDGKGGEHGGTSGGNSLEIKVKDGVVSYASATENTVKGVNGKIQNKLKINLCPDPNGKIHLETSMTASLSQGSNGSNTRIDTEVTRTVDDDARMGDLEIQQHVEAAAFGASSGTFVDMNIGLSSTTNEGNSSRVNRRSSRTTDADVEKTGQLAEIARLMAIMYTEHTREVWEKGGCVRLDTPTTPSKRTGVKPGATFSVKAQPRSKIDGSSAGGSVRGELIGETALDPAASKLRADATFTYVAPGERDKEAKVKLEAHSKRGIAFAEVPFNTRGAAYRIEGGADEFHGVGVACDLGEQFFIEGSGVTVRFEPSSAEAGRYSYSGSMSGFAVYGNGTYTIGYRDDVAVSMSARGPGSVKTPMGVQSAEGSEEYTLTPAECPES